MYRIKPLILPLTSLLMPNSMYEMNLLVNSSGAYIGIYPPSEDGEFNDRVVMTNNFEVSIILYILTVISFLFPFFTLLRVCRMT